MAVWAEGLLRVRASSGILTTQIQARYCHKGPRVVAGRLAADGPFFRREAMASRDQGQIDGTLESRKQARRLMYSCTCTKDFLNKAETMYILWCPVS
jgi:hypothetical protein